MSPKAEPIASAKAPVARAAADFTSPFAFENISSMGERSGLAVGSEITSAPT